MNKRNSTSSDTDREAREDGGSGRMLVRYFGPSFPNLPREVVVNILLRLSVRRIFVCKCVCKTWYDVISEPNFAKLHFKQAEVYPLIRTLPDSFSIYLSQSLYLVQPDYDDFEVKLGHGSLINIKLDSQFKLPLNNFKHEVDDNKRRSGRNGYDIVNSCNGLLCLSDTSYDNNDPAVIWNPATGEFINLPRVKNHILPSVGASGFGFSSATNQYKVVKLFMSKGDSVAGEPNLVWVAVVHTLGTESWREVPSIFELTHTLFITFPTYLNGCVHWYFTSETRSIICFDVEKEQFSRVSTPTVENFGKCYNTRLGVLGGQLCMSGTRLQSTGFWVMKDDAGKVWSKVFAVDLPFDDCGSYGPCVPIKYLNDGSLLMFNPNLDSLMYKNPNNGRSKLLKIDGVERIREVFAHIPSFVSLKDALSGLNVKVLNVKSRCAELKLHEEDKCVSLVEWIFTKKAVE